MSNNFNVSFNSQNAPNLDDFKDELPPMKSEEFDQHLDTEQIK